MYLASFSSTRFPFGPGRAVTTLGALGVVNLASSWEFRRAGFREPGSIAAPFAPVKGNGAPQNHGPDRR